MQTLSKQQIRAQVIKLAKFSDKQPDYYYIQGYLLGLGVNPGMVMPNQWYGHLFGEFNFESEEDAQLINALMQLYNLQMQSIMQEQIKLPTQCALSKNNYEEALAANQPLPNWTKGMLQALKLIDKSSINSKQKSELKELTGALKIFQGLKQARKEIDNERMFVDILLHHKKYLSTYIHNTIFAMRFDEDAQPNSNFDANMYDEPEYSDQEQQEMDELNEMVDILLNDDSPAIREAISGVIDLFVQSFGEGFIEENKGHFWLIQDTRAYMMLRARRAEFAFSEKRYQACADELAELLELNPNDNQANRYRLLNCYVLLQQWGNVQTLLTRFDEQSAFTLATQALTLFALQQDSKQARDAKNQLKKYNKYIEKFLTGQAKMPKETPEYYGLGDKNEAVYYLVFGGKQAWQSVSGSLFWLRRK